MSHAWFKSLPSSAGAGQHGGATVQTAEVHGLASHKPVIALTATPPRFPESLR